MKLFLCAFLAALPCIHSFMPPNIPFVAGTASHKRAVAVSTTGAANLCNNCILMTCNKPLQLLMPMAVAFSLAIAPTGSYAQEVPRSGQEIFETKCAACHAGGQNLVNPSKALTKEALQKYGYTTEAKVVEIISNGKAGMPKYAIKSKRLGLSEDEIRNTAKYVLERAEQGWK